MGLRQANAGNLELRPNLLCGWQPTWARAASAAFPGTLAGAALGAEQPGSDRHRHGTGTGAALAPADSRGPAGEPRASSGLDPPASALREGVC